MLANHRHHVMELEIGIRRAERRDPTRVRCWGSGSNSVWSRPFPKESRPLEVARRASELRVPDPGPQRDTLIAATALVHGLAMMTRNVADFLPTGVPLLDPWAT